MGCPQRGRALVSWTAVKRARNDRHGLASRAGISASAMTTSRMNIATRHGTFGTALTSAETSSTPRASRSTNSTMSLTTLVPDLTIRLIIVEPPPLQYPARTRPRHP